MKAKILIGVTLALIGSLYFFAAAPLLQPPLGAVQASGVQLCYGTSCFAIELAVTAEQRMQGLMFRPSLAADAGMLFLFEDADYHTFWMKNTLIPLDIIRLDTKLRVVDMHSVPPCTADPCPSYKPKNPARLVLELNAGTLDRLEMNIGDKFRIQK